MSVARFCEWIGTLGLLVGMLGGCGGAADLPPAGDSPPTLSAPTDVWFEIDYSTATLSTAPDWTFSSTPGWTAAEWAQSGKSAPEVRDVGNNIDVVDDPMGCKGAVMGGSGETLQLMIGLGKLVAYTSVSIRVEGRSVSASSSVIFDVYNPVNGVGAPGSLGREWIIHQVDLDLGTAVICGDALQALRITPTGGSCALALAKMRVTLLGAQWEE